MREYGSEHPAILLSDGYFKSFEKYGHCIWLRSGREALFLVALNIKEKESDPTVLMPAYCCHSMVDPFLKAGWKVNYYPLQDDLRADIDALKQSLFQSHPTAVLTMNYFGATSTTDAVSCVKAYASDCLCIEDFSHCSFSLPSIYNPNVDFYISSIRKSIGVCDGGVVISRHPLDESFVLAEETTFVCERKESQVLKARYNYTHDADTKEEYLSRLRSQETDLDHFEGVHHISKTGMSQLDSINGQEIRFARQRNMEHLIKAIMGRVETVPGIERCLDGAPFSFPILVENRDVIQQQLVRAGVYAPVLWPIPDRARGICPVSVRMADKMLSIPMDQRYNYDDIEDIARIVVEICS